MPQLHIDIIFKICSLLLVYDFYVYLYTRRRKHRRAATALVVVAAVAAVPVAAQPINAAISGYGRCVWVREV